MDQSNELSYQQALQNGALFWNSMKKVRWPLKDYFWIV